MSVIGTIAGVAGAAAPVLGSLYGSYLSNKSNEKVADKNEAFQREFAQQGLRWKVADAKKAGINPLVALGASTNTPMPSRVGTDYGDLGMSKLGQNINRAMGSKMTTEERELHELNKRLLEVKIEGQAIDNNNARNTGTGNSFPTAEYSGTPKEVLRDGTKQVPSEEIAGIKGKPGIRSGKHSKYQYDIDETGGLTINPNEKYAEVMDSHTPSWIRENLKAAELLVRNVFANSPKYGPKFDAYIRKIRPKHKDPNIEYRWDRKRLKFIPSKIKNNRTQLFTTPPKWKTRKTFKVR